MTGPCVANSSIKSDSSSLFPHQTKYIGEIILMMMMTMMVMMVMMIMMIDAGDNDNDSTIIIIITPQSLSSA